MSIVIRPFKLSDYLYYKQIRKEMVINHPDYLDVDINELELMSNNEWRQNVKEGLLTKHRFIALSDMQCIGMIGCEMRAGIMTIGSFYIKPEFRSLGIGTDLVQNCLRVATNNNCKQIQLWVSIKNAQAINWYKRLGFTSTSPPTLKKFRILPLYEELLIKFSN